MSTQSFGGNWTEQKLEALRNYLRAYRKIFTSNERAKYFRTFYVDAFAGSGVRLDPGFSLDASSQHELFDTDELTADSGFKKGSVAQADLPP